MSLAKQYCTFRLESYLFGIDVLHVQEIIRQVRTTRVPLAPPVVIGLINLRGQLVTALDLRRRLELPPRADGASTTNVVVTINDVAVALLVDEIGDVVDVSEENFEATPETITGPTRDLISGVYKLKDRLMLILDTALVIDVPITLASG